MIKGTTARSSRLFLVGAWCYCCVIILLTLYVANSYRSSLMRWYRITEELRDQRKLYEEQDTAESQAVIFCTLNRTFEYLREGAVDFARSYNLGDTVRSLYNGQTEPVAEPQRTKQKKSKRATSQRRTQKKEPVLADFSKWDKSKIDPRFIMPIDNDKFWLSSPFGTRKNPDGSRGFHYGIDMAAIHGTPVKAAGNGVVVEAGNQNGYGNVVVIDHGDGWRTRYAHCSRLRTSINKRVKQGDVIANVGSTGNARSSSKNKNKYRSASHLHFEVEVRGKRMNPFYFFLPE